MTVTAVDCKSEAIAPSVFVDSPKYVEKYPEKVLDGISSLIGSKKGEGEKDPAKIAHFCELINNVAEKHPQLADKAFKTLKHIYSHDYFSEKDEDRDRRTPILLRSIQGPHIKARVQTCTAIENIVKADPKLAGDALKFLGDVVDYGSSGTGQIFIAAKKPIRAILEKSPDSAEDVLKMIIHNHALNYIHTGHYSVAAFGEIAEDVVRAKPELAKKTASFLKEALESMPSILDRRAELEAEKARYSLQKITKVSQSESFSRVLAEHKGPDGNF